MHCLGLPEGLEAETVAGIVARAWALYSGPPGAVVEVAFLDEAEHTARHAEFLDDPAPTDVMAFPYHDEDLYGEIIVNREMCLREGRQRGIPAEQEARLYVAHGVLHLLGFRDDDEAACAQMRVAEQAVLAGN